MAQKAHPTILRPGNSTYNDSTHWNEPKLYYITSTIHKLIESCCLETNHYLNKIKINNYSDSILVHIELIHLHYRSKRQFTSRRHKENETKFKKQSWPLLACRLNTASQIIQTFSKSKKVTFSITRIKTYTRSIPRSTRKELIFFDRGSNKARYDYARHGMQLMHLLLKKRATVKTFSRFIQENICSRQRRKRHYQFLAYIKQSLTALEPYKNIQGLKIQIKGRFTHKAKGRSRSWKYQVGSMPLSQLDKNIQAEYIQTQTAYGSVGVKIWMCL